MNIILKGIKIRFIKIGGKEIERNGRKNKKKRFLLLKRGFCYLNIYRCMLSKFQRFFSAIKLAISFIASVQLSDR